MKAYAFAALAAISAASLAGCNASQQATGTQVASDACLVLQAVSASALSLPAKGTAAVNAGVAACSAISNGTSLNLASDTAAAIAAVLTLQQAGLIPAAKALAPDARLAKHRLELDYANAKGSRLRQLILAVGAGFPAPTAPKGNSIRLSPRDFMRI